MKTFTVTTTKTYTILWVKPDFSKYSLSWRKSRELVGIPIDNCFKCDKKFIDNEKLGLCCLKNEGNKILCKKCAEYLLS